VVEAWRGLRIVLSRPLLIVINILTAPLWLAFFILTLRGFGVTVLSEQVIQLFLWAAYAFTLYSSWLWGFGHGIIEEGYNGVLENLMTVKGSLLGHVVGWGLAYSMYTILDLLALMFSFYLIFNVVIEVHDWVLLVLSILLASLQLLFISTVYAMLVIKLRSSWVVTNIIQFLMPALGGLIPSESSKYFLIINEYSPIAYPFVIMRESALGYMEIPLPITYQLTISISTVIILFMITYALLRIFDKHLRIEGKLGLA
jgi:ABC-2 type transport system permease protein